MIKLKIFQYYFTIYYILGLIPFVSFENRKLKFSSIATFFPRLIIVCVHLIMVYTIIVLGNTNVSFISANLLYIIIILTNFIAIIENIKNSSGFCAIFKMMNSTINDLEMGLQIDYPYKIFKMKFHRKYILIIVLVMFGLSVKYVVVSKLSMHHFNDVSMAINYIFKYSHSLQITFYVDFVQYALNSLNGKISTYKCDWPSDETKNILYLMRQIKIIHFKLWFVLRRVQLICGWFLVAFMIEAMTNITFSTYWTFLYMDRKDVDHMNVLRKYFNFKCLNLFLFKANDTIH